MPFDERVFNGVMACMTLSIDSRPWSCARAVLGFDGPPHGGACRSVRIRTRLYAAAVKVNTHRTKATPR